MIETVANKEIVNKGINYLITNDSTLSKIILQVGEFSLYPKENHFKGLVRIIIGQQLSYKAAISIFLRLENTLQNNITPEIINSSPDELFISSGLSRNKTTYIKKLSHRVLDGSINLNSLTNQTNDFIIESLMAVKGIGSWTSNNYLIFVLGRLNILPVEDVAFKRAVKLNYGLESIPTNNEIESIASKWGTYKTIAAWYLWETINRKLV